MKAKRSAAATAIAEAEAVFEEKKTTAQAKERAQIRSARGEHKKNLHPALKAKVAEIAAAFAAYKAAVDVADKNYAKATRKEMQRFKTELAGFEEERRAVETEAEEEYDATISKWQTNGLSE